jgi:hypothetical protein
MQSSAKASVPRRPLGLAAALILASGAALLGGCAESPTSPSVAVMPPPGKPFELFVADDQLCRNWANQSINGTSAQQASTASLIGSAAVGTALGAAVGAASGGHGATGGGAAVGAVLGTAVGASEAGYAGRSVQRRYDIAYQQCMYARGNLLPGMSAAAYQSAPPPPPAGSPPPPPPGAPPPPPPGSTPPPAR